MYQDLELLKRAMGTKTSVDTVVRELVILYRRMGSNKLMLAHALQNQLIFRKITGFVADMMEHGYINEKMDIVQCKNIVVCAIHGDYQALGMIVEGHFEKLAKDLKAGKELMKAVQRGRKEKKGK
jgi:hypothetical protein